MNESSIKPYELGGHLMKKINSSAITLLLIFMIFTACQSNEPEVAMSQVPTSTAEHTDTPVPTDTEVPTETPQLTYTPQPTYTLPPTYTPYPSATTTPPTLTIDVEERISNAKILVYEDTIYIGLYIKNALDEMGLTYSHVGDQVGELMNKLTSDTDWDLIIIGGEGRSRVQGDFWDILIPKVTEENAALIVETWILDLTYRGKIQPLLQGCGIEFQDDYPLALPLYKMVGTHPVFNDPNTDFTLERFVRFWDLQAGDYMELAPDSSATILLSTEKDSTSDYAVSVSCFDGRVILQTFSNHDYRREDVIKLWENYITYTLKNHFMGSP
jgi:hypothetical protein